MEMVYLYGCRGGCEQPAGSPAKDRDRRESLSDAGSPAGNRRDRAQPQSRLLPVHDAGRLVGSPPAVIVRG